MEESLGGYRGDRVGEEMGLVLLGGKEDRDMKKMREEHTWEGGGLCRRIELYRIMQQKRVVIRWSGISHPLEK